MPSHRWEKSLALVRECARRSYKKIPGKLHSVRHEKGRVWVLLRLDMSHRQATFQRYEESTCVKLFRSRIRNAPLQVNRKSITNRLPTLKFFIGIFRSDTLPGQLLKAVLILQRYQTHFVFHRGDRQLLPYPTTKPGLPCNAGAKSELDPDT